MSQDQGPSPPEAAALDEIQQRIAAVFPSATFLVERGEDPPGWYLSTTVDIDDTEDVYNLVADRLMEMQVEEGLRVYVAPVRTPERIEAYLRELLASQSSAKQP
jgi:hypothetical protein